MNLLKSTSVLLAVAMLASTLLTGCVTRSSRNWGYTDTGIPQAQVPYNYSTVQPNGVYVLPNGGTTPLQPSNVYTASPYGYPQNNRLTYEHNTEEFDANTVFNGINTAANVFFMGAAGAALIHNMSTPYHHHRRYRW